MVKNKYVKKKIDFPIYKVCLSCIEWMWKTWKSKLIFGLYDPCKNETSQPSGSGLHLRNWGILEATVTYVWTSGCSVIACAPCTCNHEGSTDCQSRLKSIFLKGYESK